MKITIELNGKRVKKLKHDIEIEKQISSLHEKHVRMYSRDKENLNSEISMLSNKNRQLIELVTTYESEIKELKKVNLKPENTQA